MNAAVRRAPPPTGDARPVAFPPVARTALTNGLSIWAVERGPLPFVSVALVAPAGSAIDPPELPGVASLTADMLDEGTGSQSAIDIQEAFGRLGTSLDTDAGSDAVVLSLSVVARHAPEALALLAELVARPSMAAGDFDRVRALRLNRLRQLRHSPAAVADQALVRAVFGAHPYGHQPWGLSEAIERMRVEDVARLHRRAYRPSACTLIVVGSIDGGDAARIAESAFGSWEIGSDPISGADDGKLGLTQFPPAARVILIDRPGAAQTELRIGQQAAPRRTPDYHALVLLNAILGGQFVSRINMNLRERRGCTYGAHTAFDFRRLGGAFVMQTSVQTNATGDAAREALGEMAAIGTARPPSSDEIAFGHATLTRGYARNFETTGQIAGALALLAAQDLPDDTFDRFVPAVRAVGSAELAEAARRHLRPDELVVVAVGDAGQIEPELAALGLGDPLPTAIVV